MIRTVADLLLQLREMESEKVDAQGITHTGTIGRMYEVTTSKILNMALFEGLNLRIVRNSFIKDEKGKRSKEMDVILIEGEGEPLHNGDGQYDVKFEQVIAIIQSKKRINKQHITEGHLNLASFYDRSNPKNYTLERYMQRLFRDAYRGICKEDLWVDGTWRKTFDTTLKENIFDVLKWEALLPPRIIFGYTGYTSEQGFRKGTIEFLQENIRKNGFGPIQLPNLIINDEYSLVKNNGMPYCGELDNVGWPFYSSYHNNPIEHFLEIIWTRLTYKFNLDPQIFGQDLSVSQSSYFLHANVVNSGGQIGWYYSETKVPKKILDSEPEPVEWEPIKLSEEQKIIFNFLCKNEKLKINKVAGLLAEKGFSLTENSLIDGILNTGLVVFESKKYLKLLTDKLDIVEIGKDIYAGENKSGRLSNWFEKKTGVKLSEALNLTDTDL